MMALLCMHDWDKWQSYRKDRGTPPWIKVHRGLFTSSKWAVLTDAEKGQLVSLWIAAADNGGCVPDDERILRKICMLDDSPDIDKFIDAGFIDPRKPRSDAKVTSTCQPDDAPETETETEDKKNTASRKDDAEFTDLKPYKTKKGKTLRNGVLASFNEFWKAYSYTKGKAEAADSFLAVYSPEVFQDILAGARAEAESRPSILKSGGTPKWAQGWLSGRRWEDHETSPCSSDCSKCDLRRRGLCRESRQNCSQFEELKA